MYFYHHLGRGMKFYVERPDGLPVIYQDKITIPLTNTKSSQPFTDLVRLLTQYVAVGLWVDAPTTDETQPLIDESLRIAPPAVFNSAYATIKDNTAILLNKLSLRHIQEVNSQGLPYYVTPAGFVNLSESKLEVWNYAAVTNDTDAITIGVDYVIPIGKHKADLANRNV